jgi:formate/nitrite transporter
MKAAYSVGKIFRLGLISGAHIGFGAYLALTVGGNIPGIQAANPGLAKLIYGAVFPLGLMMTAITGGELFTGNTAIVTTAWVEGKVKFQDLFKSWTVSYIANFIGSVLFAALVFKAGTLSTVTLPLTVAATKVGLPFGVCFVRSVLCNWLVCMAVYMQSGCLSMTGKMIAMWFPIMAFVTLGLEHSVANMFFIPLAMMSGAKITMSQFLLNNILPVTLGNIVGAILCMMTPYGTSFGNWLGDKE